MKLKTTVRAGTDGAPTNGGNIGIYLGGGKMISA